MRTSASLSKIIAAALGVAAVSLGNTSCSSSSRHPFSFESATHSLKTKNLWSKKMDGLVTDLSLASDGKAVLVAIIPDPDRRGTHRGLYLLDRQGNTRWTFRPKAVVKEQAVANDGQLTVLTTYDEKVTAYNSKGRKIWELNELCAPIILNRFEKVICYYDDDSRPKRVFDAYDWMKGNRLHRHAAPRDVLTLKVSSDEERLVYGLTGGWIYVLDTQTFKRKWRNRIKGEIVDLSIGSGQTPYVAVVYNPSGKGELHHQRLAIFNEEGKILDHTILNTQIERVSIHDSGNPVLLYGNNPRGQSITLVERAPAGERTTKTKLEQKWQYKKEHYADYSSSLLVTEDQVIVGFENILNPKKSTERISALFGFDFEGKTRWDLPLKTENGAYLYVKNFNAEGHFLVVATDEGTLSAYDLR